MELTEFKNTKELLKVRAIDETGLCIITFGSSPINQRQFQSIEEAEKWIEELDIDLFEMMITIAGEIWGARMNIMEEEKEAELNEVEKEL